MFPVFPNAVSVAQMEFQTATWVGGGGQIQIHLFKNNFVPVPASVLADFTEVLVGDFPGYAPLNTVKTGVAYLNGAGAAEADFADVIFDPTSDPVAPITIYGYFVLLHPAAGADTLLYGVRFDVPVVVSSALQAIRVDPDLSRMPMSSPTSQ